jgi:hypothetical protein
MTREKRKLSNPETGEFASIVCPGRVYSTNTGSGRPGFQVFKELFQLRLFTLRKNFHRITIGEVTRIAGKVKLFRPAFHESTEKHALHTAMNQRLERRHFSHELLTPDDQYIIEKKLEFFFLGLSLFPDEFDFCGRLFNVHRRYFLSVFFYFLFFTSCEIPSTTHNYTSLRFFKGTTYAV